MRLDLDFHETYLYKLHLLTNALDKVFDQALQHYAAITLSQFLVLAAISQHEHINQRRVAHYLEISPVAVKRQVDIAKDRQWLENSYQPIRGEGLRLTPEGAAVVKQSLQVLEQYVFSIFEGQERGADLMQHIDLLLSNVKEVLPKIRDTDNAKQTTSRLDRRHDYANPQSS
jgi:DNA-binding MarR family transcriptional regulator